MKRLFLCLFLMGSAFAMDKDASQEKPVQEDQTSECHQCPCCLEPIPYPALLTCAQLCEDGDPSHTFHRECIRKHLCEGTGAYGCPICRRPVKKELEETYKREVQPEERMSLADMLSALDEVPSMGRMWFSQRDQGASHDVEDGIHAGRESYVSGWDFLLEVESRRRILSEISHVSLPVLMAMSAELQESGEVSSLIARVIDEVISQRGRDYARFFMNGFIAGMADRLAAERGGDSSPAGNSERDESGERGDPGCPIQ